MKKKGMTKYRLIKEFNFSNGTIDRLRSNKHINTFTVEKLCKVLNCEPNDIFKIMDK